MSQPVLNRTSPFCGHFDLRADGKCLVCEEDTRMLKHIVHERDPDFYAYRYTEEGSAWWNQ